MGAVLEIWAVDRAALERRLDDPDAHWDEALEKACAFRSNVITQSGGT
ncbi:MAG: hypothetical protein JO007_20615 [Alphaproteobacteria bacterium]|nr:hypothetical protein [Alphaproteobacteria bacterium]